MNPVKKIWFDENSTPPKNMIWYRGEGKFYEWKNNDWVLCYNLVDVATQEQLERNNYVIAQALNDLNERVGELQSQVAQHDYIYFDVPDSFDTGDAAFGAIWPELEEKAQNGTLLDVVFRNDDKDSYGAVSRVVGYQFDEQAKLSKVFIITLDGIIEIHPPE